MQQVSAGGGSRLRQQDRVLHKRRITAIIRRLWRTRKKPKTACSGTQEAGAGPPLSLAVSWGELLQGV